MQLPFQLGKYRVTHQLATGGMGEVFLARHEGLAGFAKTVVIKCILPHLASDQRFVELFLNEARLAALLSHPNIVQIFELGKEEGRYFIAMEYIPGRSLRRVLRRVEDQGLRLPVPLAARICSLALQGLHYAHSRKNEAGQPLRIVHRDISPENVLISFDGALKVVDFGIAKAVDLTTAFHSRTLHGKFSYMAPELPLPTLVDGRADVFGVGILLYELLTGSPPWSIATAEEFTQHQRHPKQWSPARERNPAVTPELEQILSHALARKPEERFESAELMALALERFIALGGESPGPLEMAAFMRQLFGEEGEDSLDQKPAGTRPLLAVSEAATIVTQRAPQAAPSLLHPPGSPRRGWLGAGLTAAVVLSLALGYTFWPRSVPPVIARAPAPTTPVVAPPQEPPPVPVVNPAPPRPARAKPRTAEPQHALVSIRVHPWAEIWWRGRSLGTTPLPPQRLPVGRQTLLLRNRALGIEKRVSLDVLPQEGASLEVNLMQAKPAAQLAGGGDASKK